MRRSARSTRSKQVVQEPNYSDLSGEGDSFDDDSGNSEEEEWKPEKGKKGRKREREASGESEDDEEAFTVEEEEEEEEEDLPETSSASRKKKIKIVQKDAYPSTSKPAPSRRPIKQSNVVSDQDILAVQAMIEAEEEEERQEQEAATKEAAELWNQFRKRKQQGLSKTVSKSKEEKNAEATIATASLTSWLGIPDPDWPTSCNDAMINDRDSLFVGYVYSLTTPSLSTISQLLSHLSKIVHPKTIPTERLPPAMQHLSINRRGATHDMHAWRCLALKRGRSGLNGPEDFGLEEGMEDDGERFGAKEIAKVIKQLGATDVLVVVSRWYGGTMLGPIRFQHIENCAKAALSQYLINEGMTTLKQELRDLDDKLVSLRSQLPGSSTIVKAQYEDLDPEKAERLIIARKKAIDMLKKRVDAVQSDAVTASAAAHMPSAPQTGSTESTLNSGATSAFPKEAGEATTIPENITASEIAIKEENHDDDLTGWDALE